MRFQSRTKELLVPAASRSASIARRVRSLLLPAMPPRCETARGSKKECRRPGLTQFKVWLDESGENSLSY